VTADLASLDGAELVVAYRGRSVTVRVVDRCVCGSRHLDLYLDAFELLASPGAGRLYDLTIRKLRTP
jgi:rare lipoprotein A (peptidoglycan hydrolase)